MFIFVQKNTILSLLAFTVDIRRYEIIAKHKHRPRVDRSKGVMFA